MSSTGQILGGIVGAVVGYFAGNPWLGAQIGMSIGGYIDPPKGPTIEGPRLDDLAVQTSTYGAPIPRLYGTAIIAGNVFWLENNRLKEVRTETESGKGGPQQTSVSYSYYATFAVGLCEGPIVGIRRIWIGANLIYNAGSNDAATISASTAAAAGFRVYLGSDDQLPDERIQAALGIDNTPAWRGLAYLVFDDLALEKYGNTLAGAQVRVEVIKKGVVYAYPATTFTQPAFSWTAPVWDGTVWCSVAVFNHIVALSVDGLNWSTASIPNGNSPVYKGVATDGAGVLLAYGATATNVWRSTDHGASWQSVTLPGFTGYVTHIVHNGSYYLAVTDSGPFFSSPNGLTWTARTPPVSGTTYGKTLCWHQASGKWYVHNYISASKSIWATSDLFTWTPVYTLTGDLNNFNLCCVHNNRLLYMGVGTVTTYGSCLLWSDDGVTWNKVQAPSRSAIFSDGQNCWIGVVNNTMYYSATGISDWTAWSRPAQTASSYAHGYANGMIVCMGDGVAVGFRINKVLATTIPATLAEIVSSECLATGILTAGDIDVSALAASATGYRIGRQVTVRSALEPLQAAFPFDAVQTGYKIRFKPRGGATLATIAAGDLDARGVNDSPGVAISNQREMDSQLPRRLTVKYLDVDRDHDLGEQYAERANTVAVNQVVLDLPIVLTATEAARIAEVRLYAAWLDRYALSFNLPATYNHFEPADVIDLPTAEGTLNVRLRSIEYTSDGRLACKANYNLAAIYSPVALGDAGQSLPVRTIVPLGPTVLQLLDIPLVNDAQDYPSFVVALCGTASSWPGGALMRSIDGGLNWVRVRSVGAPGATIGYASNTLSNVDARLLDKAGRLTVTLSAGDLYDSTLAGMFAGANHFAYGADGRWEIVAAQKCTLQSGATYILSDFWRGRFGTDWAMGLHQVGDALILLDAEDLKLLDMSSGTIGLSRLYRAVTFGRDMATDTDHAFTYNAVNLKPLSPILLTGNRHPSSNDWTLTWQRRTRGVAEWRDNVDAPIGESSEQYQVDIYSGSGYTTVKRTLTVNTPQAVYDSAMQVADFGASQPTLYVKIYQMSSVVGRGYALTQSITR